MSGEFWPCGVDLELSSYTLRRPFPVHFHEEAVVAVIVSGAEAILVDGCWHLAEAGTVVVIEPERAHQNVPVRATGAHYLGFYATRALLERAGVPLVRQGRAPLLDDPRMARRLVELHHALAGDPGAATAEVVAAEIARAFAAASPGGAPDPPTPAVFEAARILRQRCAEPLTWPEIARMTDHSPAHLARRFRRHFGLPPHAFRTQYRISLAKRLLRAGTDISAVAARCGFADQSHMTHRFTSYVGQTPGVFRAGRAENYKTA